MKKMEGCTLVFEEDITEGVNGSEFYTRRNVHYFSFPVLKFKEDLARELAMYRASLRIIKLRIESNIKKRSMRRKWGLSEQTFHGWKKGRSIRNYLYSSN